ncbi:unnamed protein product [Rotaria sordida]|uniref:Uncharacterized protein n=1 Tax=Rotaria sordida TaxID=392033 RepID=A0A813TZS5_9BILA|nr:unnamed protein product [Rotaria sordida]CAF0815476.1 unnamed protein product [Rotaria sordida]CAF0816733.1 unnamed protein product [Rotaria sordida]
MAQRNTISTRKEPTSSTKQQVSSTRFQSSLSQPTPIDSTNQQKSNIRRHLTLPIYLNNTYPQSPAERYITGISQTLMSPNEQLDISPETPSSIISSITQSSINSIQRPMSHAELMNRWHQKKANEICKKQKHRYIYGTPLSPSVQTPTSLDMIFSSPMYFKPTTPSNLPSPSQKNDLQLPMPSNHTVKKKR